MKTCNLNCRNFQAGCPFGATSAAGLNRYLNNRAVSSRTNLQPSVQFKYQGAAGLTAMVQPFPAFSLLTVPELATALAAT